MNQLSCAEVSWAQLGQAGLGWAGLAAVGLPLAVCSFELINCWIISIKKSFTLHRFTLLPADPKLRQCARHALCHKWKHHILAWAHKTSECQIIRLRNENYEPALASHTRRAHLRRTIFARKNRPSQEHMHAPHTSRSVHARVCTMNTIEQNNETRPRDSFSGLKFRL